jgi:hypothetical protein
MDLAYATAERKARRKGARWSRFPLCTGKRDTPDIEPDRTGQDNDKNN